MKTFYIPNDSTALAAGADELSDALQQLAADQARELTVIRNGSRGLCWLEPLIEVASAEGRIAYGPVSESDLPSLLDAVFTGDTHPLQLGPVEEIPYLRAQNRITFKRAGLYDPLDWQQYLHLDGTLGLKAALQLEPQQVIEQINVSGLRGRGGAAFPAAIKWQTVHDADSEPRYIVCNADEGDSGTFADRLLIEADPLSLIEGMVIAGWACQASKGYIYLRSEYPLAAKRLRAALALACQHKLTGKNIFGSGFDFDIELRIGAGSYVCGEETALLESLEGKRGMVRVKPPLPAHEGLFGKPTLIHNVLTLATCPHILQHGGEHYASFGHARSRGTITLQLAGNIAHGGLVEIAFGSSLRALLEKFGGGAADGELQAIQIGGPLGAYLNKQQWDVALDYEALAAIGAGLGHGGIVAFGENTDLAQQAHFAMAFCAHESCGKCTPCRIGSQRGVEIIERMQHCDNDDDRNSDRLLLRDLCETMQDASLCAMGSMTPIPVLSILDNFPQSFISAHERGHHD